MPEVKLVGSFKLTRGYNSGPWDVYYVSQHMCRVERMPSKEIADPYDFTTGAYKVTAQNFPGVGNLEQIVRAEDLVQYLESVRAGRERG